MTVLRAPPAGLREKEGRREGGYKARDAAAPASRWCPSADRRPQAASKPVSLLPALPKPVPHAGRRCAVGGRTRVRQWLTGRAGCASLTVRHLDVIHRLCSLFGKLLSCKVSLPVMNHSPSSTSLIVSPAPPACHGQCRQTRPPPPPHPAQRCRQNIIKWPQAHLSVSSSSSGSSSSSTTTTRSSSGRQQRRRRQRRRQQRRPSEEAGSRQRSVASPATALLNGLCRARLSSLTPAQHAAGGRRTHSSTAGTTRRCSCQATLTGSTDQSLLPPSASRRRWQARLPPALQRRQGKSRVQGWAANGSAHSSALCITARGRRCGRSTAAAGQPALWHCMPRHLQDLRRLAFRRHFQTRFTQTASAAAHNPAPCCDKAPSVASSPLSNSPRPLLNASAASPSSSVAVSASSPSGAAFSASARAGEIMVLTSHRSLPGSASRSDIALPGILPSARRGGGGSGGGGGGGGAMWRRRRQGRACAVQQLFAR